MKESYGESLADHTSLESLGVGHNLGRDSARTIVTESVVAVVEFSLIPGYDGFKKIQPTLFLEVEFSYFKKVPKLDFQSIRFVYMLEDQHAYFQGYKLEQPFFYIFIRIIG
jgi:hypothetical protein